MSEVKRVYVEKKKPYAVKARELMDDIKDYLGIEGILDVRVLVRYDIENISEKTYKMALNCVFSEPPVDDVYEETFPYNARHSRIFGVEYLPGQFDQRSDSAVQCINFLNPGESPIIKTATTYVLLGTLSDDDFKKIKEYCINPVDSRETGMEKPDTLVTVFEKPKDVAVFGGFKDMDEKNLRDLYDSLSLAMTFKDFLHIQNYFKNDEDRDPTVTEIRVLDTYWSDHCRHTTFRTELKNVEFGDGYYRKPFEDTYNDYMNGRTILYGNKNNKPICLMDLALLAMKRLKSLGKLDDEEESEEINACSIIVPVEIDGKKEDWLINFKNETHNHPTEIEPFGGAATCLGGAIRDPLSGRTYVYQAMRVTGAADPTVSMSKTLRGKLPQKKIVQEAANGYSSYGNQIGLATGYVKEIYHPDYVAKRMEVGAVIGAAPKRAVKKLSSNPGDLIVLLGGRTGRDGCGGATGSSKIHTEESIETCGAEVQKGNAPTERKMQRLFRREEVSRLIKKCNDFGAGGVSVAIGELADGLHVYLDKVPKKYEGLDGTELAISESQERMAVVIDKNDRDAFLKYAAEENLEATVVAYVTEEPRLVLEWRGNNIVNISRDFMDTNGAKQEASVFVEIPSKEDDFFNKPKVENLKKKWLDTLGDLNVCSQKGLVEKFDGSIGAGSVLMPHGGRYQKTETQTMVAKLPVQSGDCDTVTIMSYGFDPYLSTWSPYHGAIYAVTDAIAKIVASGGDYHGIRMTCQEYFRRMSDDPHRWSQPFASLLGAYDAQMGFGLASIGGKDSMSGTFNDMNVPPTLVAFAVDVAKEDDIITPEFKFHGSYIVKFVAKRDSYEKPDYEKLMYMYDHVHEMIQKGVIVSAYAVDKNGLAPAISKMAFGNRIGVSLEDDISADDLFSPGFGDIVAEVPKELISDISIEYVLVGKTTDRELIEFGKDYISLDDSLEAWEAPLDKVFPAKAQGSGKSCDIQPYSVRDIYVCKNKVAKPSVFIPVFPGTNCEYDTAKAFEEAGANVVTKVFRNLTPNDITDSVNIFEKCIDNAQIIMFPGGFSAGDEPDGSAKFFATAFRNAKIQEAVTKLLDERDGLALGICNGFQAMIKLGLVPNGKIIGQGEESPTLTYNTINRHISKMVYTKVVSNKSPWLMNTKPGDVYVNPASHGEGRFVASNEKIQSLIKNGQVATQYVDPDGNATMDGEWNVNGSYQAIEGITSPDGRCFAKMAHVERKGRSVAKNIYGKQNMKVFEAGVEYFL